MPVEKTQSTQSPGEVARKHLERCISLAVSQVGINEKRLTAPATVRLKYDLVSQKSIPRALLGFIDGQFPNRRVYLDEIEASVAAIYVRVRPEIEDEIAYRPGEHILLPEEEIVVSNVIMIDPSPSTMSADLGNITYELDEFSLTDVYTNKTPRPKGIRRRVLDPEVLLAIADILPDPNVRVIGFLGRRFYMRGNPFSNKRVSLGGPSREIAVPFV